MPESTGSLMVGVIALFNTELTIPMSHEVTNGQFLQTI